MALGALSLVVARLPYRHSADNGRPGIDPEVAVRLMFAGLPLGIVHDRKLMRESQVNIGYAGSSAARAPARPFGPHPYPPALGRAPFPGDLSAYGHRLSGGEDRHGRDGSHQCHADPGERARAGSGRT